MQENEEKNAKKLKKRMLREFKNKQRKRTKSFISNKIKSKRNELK